MTGNLLIPRATQVVGILLIAGGVVLSAMSSSRTQDVLLLLAVGLGLSVLGSLWFSYAQTGSLRQSAASLVRQLALPVVLGLILAAVGFFRR